MAQIPSESRRTHGHEDTLSDRRDPARQHPVLDGRRHDDPRDRASTYYTVLECATWLGNAGEDYIRDAINQGKWSRKQGRMVQLKAAFLPGRTAKSPMDIRIHHDDFVDFLHAVEWPRIPAPPR